MSSILHRFSSEYVRPHLLSFSLASLCLLATNYLTVSIPEQIGMAIDHFEDDALTPIWNIIWMGTVIIIVRTLSRVWFFNPGRDIEYQIRQDLFSHLLALQPSFYANQKRGDIISRASNDITWTRAMIGFGGMSTVNISLALLLTAWKMLDLSVPLTLYTFIPISLGFVFGQYSIQKLHPLMRRNQEELSVISGHVLESLHGMTTIQGFGAQQPFLAQFTKYNEQWFETSIKLSVLSALLSPLVALCTGASVFLLFYIGGPMSIRGEVTVGQIAAFIGLIAALVPYMRSLGWLLSVWQRGQASLERIYELLDAPIDRPELQSMETKTQTEVMEKDVGVHLELAKGPSIRVQNLSFSYPDKPTETILSDISFDISSGNTIGIFGQTGSGKSTLLRILSRQYNPPEETVFIDNIDATKLNLFQWRRKFTYVPQKSFLFSDSIQNNITMFQKASDDAIHIVVQKSSLEQDLKLFPDGLQTLVGERGVMLSGGQRQRVALARGLFRMGDLIMLDDVLSAVDHENEKKLVAELSRLSSSQKKNTVILVSNRLSAFRFADLILVLDKGRIVAQGTHEELILQEGLYKETWKIQSNEESKSHSTPHSNTLTNLSSN